MNIIKSATTLSLAAAMWVFCHVSCNSAWIS